MSSLKSLLIIDSTVNNYQQLSGDLTPQTNILLLQKNENSISNITEYLLNHQPFKTIHILSHGTPGCLYLGNETLSLDTLSKYTEQLAKWKAQEIFLYGCNVAAGDAGEEFITKLHNITGASIAASKTLTGNASLGGDWNLEATRGQITSPLAISQQAREAYTGVLATYTVDVIQDQNDGFGINGTSLRDGINAANNNPGEDKIIFDSALNGQILNLNKGELYISDNLEIEGNRFKPITINGLGFSRIFQIGYTNTKLEGLKIINGNNQYGGGILNSYGTLKVTNCTIENNKASDWGAGIANNQGTVTLINSTVFNNSAGNVGGGFFNNSGEFIVLNSTISNNKASTAGGGIYNNQRSYYDGSKLIVFHSTITKNTALTGGGIATDSNAEATELTNTIVAGNASNDVDIVEGEVNKFVSFNGNLIGTGNAIGIFTSLQDQTGVTNPGLGPLTNNGGGTLTHALLPGSPAINAGSNIALPFDSFDINGDGNVNQRIPFDQTGNTRIQDGIVDIGAVESSFQGEAPPQLTLQDASVAEGNSGNTSLVFPIVLSKPFNQPITLKYSTVNGTATSPSDFVGASSQTLTIPANQVSSEIVIAVKGDTAIEPDESFTLKILPDPVNATINDGQAIGGILNDDVTSVSLDKDLTISEGNAGQKILNFPITLSKPSAIPVKVNVSTVNGSATGGSDFNGGNQFITFAPNTTKATFRVTVRGDKFFEPQESFFVKLSNPVNAVISKAQVTGTITNDDSKPKISINDLTVTEGNAGLKTGTFTVKLTNPSSQTITADFITVNGSAVAPSDYNATSNTVVFAPGQTTKPINVQVKGDKLFEGNETFSVRLSDLKNVDGGDLTGVATIRNDDAKSKALLGNAESFSLGVSAESTKQLASTITLDRTPIFAASSSSQRINLEGITQPDLFAADFSGTHVAAVI